MEQDNAKPPRSRASHHAADALVAVLIFAIGVVMMIDNRRLGAGWASDGPESGYFPFRIGAIMCICSAAIFAQLMLAKKRRNEAFVLWDRFLPVLKVALPTMAYVLAIQFLGIYVASTLFIGAFMKVMGGYDWLKTLAVSVGTSAMLFWMFEVQFLVPLPKGPLEALFGY